MKSRLLINAVAVGMGLAGAMLASGCITTPPVAQGLVAAPVGTVTTLHRKEFRQSGEFRRQSGLDPQQQHLAGQASGDLSLT